MNRVTVIHTPSAELMADGLTKALALPQFREFRKQVRMTEQKTLLERNREQDLAEDEAAWVAKMAKEDIWDMEFRAAGGARDLSL